MEERKRDRQTDREIGREKKMIATELNCVPDKIDKMQMKCEKISVFAKFELFVFMSDKQLMRTIIL